MRALREMSIEMSSGCRDVEPEGLMSSAVQWSEEPLGIPNINSDELARGVFDSIKSRTLPLFTEGMHRADAKCCNFLAFNAGL